MRRGNFTVFDEFIPLGTINTAPVYTSPEFNGRLAQFDQLAIQVVIDNVSGGPIGGFDLYVEHSGDGRHFSLIKQAISEPAPSGSGDVCIPGALSTTGTNLHFGALDGSMPLLGFLRFRMFFANKTTSAHVRIHVTQRDQGG